MDQVRFLQPLPPIQESRAGWDIDYQRAGLRVLDAVEDVSWQRMKPFAPWRLQGGRIGPLWEFAAELWRAERAKEYAAARRLLSCIAQRLLVPVGASA